MLTKRIIPCLDILDGRTVKGTNFVDLRDAGNPVELGAEYARQGADELVFLDITASEENRKTLARLVRDIAMHLNIPFTVGGGIGQVSHVEPLLEAGADKISVNSSAVNNPGLIDELAKKFGSQILVVAIDAKKEGNAWRVFTHGGKKITDKRLFSWAKEAENRGAGEILFTSMSHDGTRAGFANDALWKLNELLHIPVIASGGAGNEMHFLEAFTLGKADAALAAGIFHFGEMTVPQVKKYLSQHQIPVRL
ncbi:MAG: imidazole glycerol phosphate synthase subunit HisF [Candidatus Nephrothrix sp. EaCA]|nr:MAG: imidazole glycerol phosphate synthase subunit HisF [Candidatus Nephrothrix sp. EaCA]